MIVTIFTDISMSSCKAVTVWAMWAVSNRGSMEHAAPFKGPTHGDTDIAEAYAILNAIAAVRARGIAEAGDKLLIQSDSGGAYGLLDHKRASPEAMTKTPAKFKANPQKYEARFACRAYFQAAVEGYEWEFRHVKGHTSGREPHFNRNRQVDALARTVMRNTLAAQGKKPLKATASEKFKYSRKYDKEL